MTEKVDQELLAFFLKHDGEIPPPSVRGIFCDQEILRLLSTGWTVENIAVRIKISKPYIKALRDSPEGYEYLRIKRSEKDIELKGTTEDAHRILLQSAAYAAQTLVDRLDSPRSSAAIRAALEILNRVGLSAVAKTEATVKVDSTDYSKLSDEELEQLMSLHTKASAK